MGLFPSPGLSEEIVQLLRHGPLDTSSLIKQLHTKTRPVTVQGVYKALRGLRAEHIVFLQQGEATLNLRWLHELESFTTLAEHAYRDSTAHSGHFLQLHDGDRISYSFKNPIQVDAFWNHVLYSLFEALPKLDAWFAYASHCWFLLGRREEELALQKFMLKRGIRYLFTVGHSLALDKAVKQDFDGTHSQYAMLNAPLFNERANRLGIVLNVIGPFIIEAQYDKQTVERIEHFYRTTFALTPEKQSELEAIVALPARIKFVITRHERRAEKLRRLFSKRFYLPTKR